MSKLALFVLFEYLCNDQHYNFLFFSTLDVRIWRQFLTSKVGPRTEKKFDQIQNGRLAAIIIFNMHNIWEHVNLK